MKAIVVTRKGSPVAPNIEFREDWPDVGQPGAGQVLIKTLASAFNQMDLWVGRGVPGLDLAYPRVSGCDSCGIVEAIGAGVDPSWIGQRVIVNAAMRVPDRMKPEDPPASTLAPNYELIGEHHNGMHAEKFIAPVENIAAVGQADAAQAAAFGLCGLTAYSMMVTKGQLRPGQSVLITGIGGGVATAALSIALHMGCKVVVTSRHAWKLDKALALGAHFGVLDQGQDWSKEVRGITAKRGVDMAVDSSGKATHFRDCPGQHIHSANCAAQGSLTSWRGESRRSRAAVRKSHPRSEACCSMCCHSLRWGRLRTLCRSWMRIASSFDTG